MILVIDNYDSFTFNLTQLIESLGERCLVVRNDAMTIEDVEQLSPDKVVISPGPGKPSEAGMIIPLIQKLAGKVPILGICLGHQAIAEAFGGKVVRAQRPIHGKQSRIFHQRRGLMAGISGSFLATRYHSLVAERETLPDCLEVTCETKEGVVMGLRHRSLDIEGLQFHPESLATEKGREILAAFLEEGQQK